MKKNVISSKDLFLMLIAVCFLVVYYILYPQLFPNASLRLNLSKNQIIEKASEHLNKAGYKNLNYEFRPTLQQNIEQIRYLQTEFGLDRCNEIISQNRIPVYFWRIRLKGDKSDSGSVHIVYNSDHETENSTNNALSDTINLALTTDGRLFELKVKLDKKRAPDSHSNHEASTLADKFLETNKLNKNAEYKLITPETDNLNSNGSFTFSWENEALIYNEKESVTIEIENGLITKYQANFKPPKIIKKSSTLSQLKEVSAAILFIIIFIFFIVLLIQKLKVDAIDLKSNFWLAVVVASSWIFMLYTNIYPTDEKFPLAIILPIIITTPFIFMAFIGVSSIAESECREVWSDKLFTFDAVKKGHFLFPQFSMALLRGLSLAFISAGTLVIILKVASLKFNFFMDFESRNIYDKFTFFPLIFILSVGILNSSFGEFVFRFFFVSWFRKIPSRSEGRFANIQRFD